MLAQMPAGQFEEWRAYADVEPWDEQRADFRAAQVVQAVYNAEIIHAIRARRALQGTRLRAIEECLLRLGDQQVLDEGAKRGAAADGPLAGVVQLVNLARMLRKERRANAKRTKRRNAVISKRRALREQQHRESALSKRYKGSTHGRR